MGSVDKALYVAHFCKLHPSFAEALFSYLLHYYTTNSLHSEQAIEAHMEECGSVNSPHGRNASIVNNEKSYTLNGPDGSTINIGHGLSKVSMYVCLLF